MNKRKQVTDQNAAQNDSTAYPDDLSDVLRGPARTLDLDEFLGEKRRIEHYEQDLKDVVIEIAGAAVEAFIANERIHSDLGGILKLRQGEVISFDPDELMHLLLDSATRSFSTSNALYLQINEQLPKLVAILQRFLVWKAIESKAMARTADGNMCLVQMGTEEKGKKKSTSRK